MHTVLVAASQTLAAFLRQRLESDPNLRSFFDPGAGGTMVVSLSNPQEFEEAPAEGVSIWLYRVVRDENRLNDPARREGPRELRLPPLPVRLHYLITPIVRPGAPNGPELEQTVLGKVLQALHDHPTFRGVDLQGDLSGSAAEFNARLETMSLEEITRVWNALDASYQLSVSYEVSLLEIRSERTDAMSPVIVALPEPSVIVGSEAR